MVMFHVKHHHAVLHSCMLLIVEEEGGTDLYLYSVFSLEENSSMRKSA